MATVTPLPDGPLKIEGAQLLDAEGKVVEDKPAMFLCRCGHSANKPFCDASHKAAGFKS
jgi:CDGSH-type Zn-finger protein